MELLESFTLQHIDDVLRNTFSFSVENKLNYSMNKFNDNDNMCYLEVKGEGIFQQYVLLKVLNYKAESEKNPSVLQPVFVIQNNQSESFGAFEREHLKNFISPEENNLDHLKTILKTLAQFQAKILNINEDNVTLSEYRVKDVTDNILSLDYFNCEENAKINETLEKLQVMLNGLLKTNLLVPSIWSSLASNVYVKKDSSNSVFLQVTSKQLLMPPSYDALLYICSLSDDKFRQKHFQDLRSYYFKSLTDALQLHNNNAVELVSRKHVEPEIETLLPIVKFSQANELAKNNPSPRFKEILINILNYLRYPMINQEDIYEAIKNTMLSDEYDLLSYKLLPLDETNGHLGEYFHLKISIKFQTKERQLNLFAKFILVNTALFSYLIDRGAGKKEDFFYSILYPLYLEHGLEKLLNFSPKCYVSRLGFLVLEDLGSLGYTGLKPNSILNFQSLKTILAKVAKFHACTLIAEEVLSKQSGNKVRLGDDYAEYLKETLLIYEDQTKDWFEGNLKSFYYIYDKCPDISEKISLPTEQLKEKIKEILFSPFQTVKISDTIRNVVNHGDMYVANMLFKFGQDKSIEDGILIDFQLLRYIPPAFEVLFFIYVSATKETRDKYWQSLLNWYYENLSGHLKTFSLDPEEIISREQFNEDINNSKSAALVQAFNYSNLIQVDADFREEMFQDPDKLKYYLIDNKEAFIDIAWKQEHYKIFVKGLIEDLIDFIKTSV